MEFKVENGVGIGDWNILLGVFVFRRLYVFFCFFFGSCFRFLVYLLECGCFWILGFYIIVLVKEFSKILGFSF